MEKDQTYPDHPDRFDLCAQALSAKSLSGQCYWEVDWKGGVSVSLSYGEIKRKGNSSESRFGENDQSWTLICSDNSYTISHNNRRISYSIPEETPHKVAVYVDCPAGTMSFYRVSIDNTLSHLHTFNEIFSGPLYPGFGFGFWSKFGSSVTLCCPD